MSPKTNLWAKLSDKLSIVLPNREEFDPSQFFGLALLESHDWPPSLLAAHWLWTGSKSGEHPVMRLGKDVATVRRVLYCLTCMDPEPRGGVYFKVKCGNMSCVNPTHFEALGKKGYKVNNSSPTNGVVIQPPDVVQELADELMEQFGAREPESFADVMSRPVICEFTEDQVRAAMQRAGLKIQS